MTLICGGGQYEVFEKGTQVFADALDPGYIRIVLFII